MALAVGPPKKKTRTNASISVDRLAAEIARELSVFSKDVIEKVNISSERVGKTVVQHLKFTSPKDKGDYAKSWTMSTEREFAQPHKRIIHVKSPHYRLTHLLEYGHAKRGGGRVEAKPHIRLAEEMAINDFVNEVEKAIEEG